MGDSIEVVMDVDMSKRHVALEIKIDSVRTTIVPSSPHGTPSSEGMSIHLLYMGINILLSLSLIGNRIHSQEGSGIY